MLEDFRNEPFTDFSQAESRSAFESALARVDRQRGVEVPLVIGGRRLKTGHLLENRNPAERAEVLSRHHLADRKTAAKALEVAVRAQKTWSGVAPRERASVLLRAAARMRERKHEFSATMVLEIGKSWPEADVETAEAIDFLEFYAREMLRWGGEIPVTPYRGEFPETVYVPLGAGAVIPPWNFPNAILTGMTSAAVVTGNAVILKPASDTPLIAWKVFTVLEEAGVPDGVLNYLPGPGSDVGDFLVEAPATRFISFTGSKAVGLGIHEKAAKVARGQRWIKRTVLEMGGKDFIVVDEDADFEFAVSQVVASAFGFQGQKCSACSRAIVHRRLYKRFVDAVVSKTAKLKQGPTRDHTELPRTRRVRAAAQDGHGLHQDRQARGEARDGRHVERARRQLRRPDRLLRREAVGARVPGGDLRSRPRNHRGEGLRDADRARERERVWPDGLVLRARPVPHRGGQEAPSLREPLHQRKCTGALVGVHPFGGFDMSGTDSKAGGRDYLGLFLQAKSISEKLL